MLAFKRLRVIRMIRAAGGVTHMSDGGMPRVFGHQFLVRFLLIHPEDLGDTADIFMSHHQLQPTGFVGRESSRQLAAILHVQQHAWDHA